MTPAQMFMKHPDRTFSLMQQIYPRIDQELLQNFDIRTGKTFAQLFFHPNELPDTTTAEASIRSYYQMHQWKVMSCQLQPTESDSHVYLSIELQAVSALPPTKPPSASIFHRDFWRRLIVGE